MPELSRFYGVIISMYAKDHSPPHFHVKYGEFVAYFSIETGKVIEGEIPKRATKMVEEWWELYKDELIDNWKESQKDNPNIKKIPPLV